MPNALEMIGQIKLDSAQASVVFSNISNQFKDLQVVVTPKGSGGNGVLGVQYNGDTTNNYSDTYIYGESSGAGAASATRAYTLGSLSTIGTTFNPILTMSIFDYSSTDKHKITILRYGNNDVSGVMAIASRWASTSAITSIVFKFSGTDTFAAGSTFSLYGVLA